MILHRVIDHVRQQHWTAIAIDFVIVVVGVFVGIEVSNRNAERINAERQESLLQELVVDLRADIEDIDGALDLASLRSNAAETLVTRVTGWRMPAEYPDGFGTRQPLPRLAAEPPRDAPDALYFAQRYSGFDMERRTYDSLVAGGDLKFVKRPGLAAKLRSRYAKAETWSRTEATRQRQADAALSKSFMRHGLSILEDVDWQELDGIVKGDPELIGQLKTAVWEAAVQDYYLRRIRAETVALIEEIEHGETAVPSNNP